MASLPKARTTVSATAQAGAGGIDTICVIAPVPNNADAKPRQFGSAGDVYTQHGYSRAIEYCALHAEQVGKPFIVVGVPIATPGAISRQNTSGNTGTCTTTITAGASGVLCEHDGILRAPADYIVGTDQTIIEVSLDGGRLFKRVRIGQGTSYTVPHMGVTIGLSVGTIKAGEILHTWHGSDPLADSDGYSSARVALSKQKKRFRSILLIGDLQNSTEAAAYLAQLNAYETAHNRFVYGRASVRDRAPTAQMGQVRATMTGAPSLTFAEVGATGDTIARSVGSFVSDGFIAGDTIEVTLSASNNVTGTVATVAAATLTLGSLDLVAEGPVAGCAIVASPTLTFATVGAGGTITRSRGSWLVDGFYVGAVVGIAGTASNNLTGIVVSAVTETVLTFTTAAIVAESIGSIHATITAGLTKAAWMADIEQAFASIDAAPRIDMSAGRGRVLSPFTGWNLRQPAAWAASLREYQHDLHIATWRKADGPTGFSLDDADGQTVEWDDTIDGEAGSAARFTVFRTFDDPDGAFIAQSLTRATDGDLRGLTHNVAVCNLAQQVVQSQTETAAIGQTLILNLDGTATTSSLSAIEDEVNTALDKTLLTNDRGEGQRTSYAVWAAVPTTKFDVPEPHLVGVLTLKLNGTIHSIDTTVRIKTGAN